MKFFSTNNKQHNKSFREAVIQGLAPDRGLYFPTEIPVLSQDFFRNISTMSLPDIAFEVMYPYVKEDMPSTVFLELVKEILNFDIPLVKVSEDVFSLELYHGPTLAFKDVGARFMSRCLSQFSDKKVRILVATSGDTGSAVANGFFGVENVEVVILYPSNKISDIQEKQLTTLGGNITALEVDGNFDDCQRLVKEAFQDDDLKTLNLSSANSINIARWLPQSIYYYWIVAQLGHEKKISVSVPSGNFGNITAGLLAKKTGLAIDQFIAATNINDIIPSYLQTGTYMAKPSQQTISNAMDVGDPSNFYRLLALFDNDFDRIKSEVIGYSLEDESTRKVINDVFQKHQYILDPHGAVGYKAVIDKGTAGNIKVFLETASPVKFREVVEPIIGQKLPVPERLKEALSKSKSSIKMKKTYSEFKAFLLHES